NFNLKLRAVGRKTPFDAVLKWYDEKPDIFIINPNHLNAGLNNYSGGRDWEEGGALRFGWADMPNLQKNDSAPAG
ncbi:MAG: hypothetical protein PHH59_01355, partial [Methylovulum sp.]|nr:hypothetical protein [Methylovulum sp.]MDD5123873.1 hypothetical protein [Methylovulum sp.]